MSWIVHPPLSQAELAETFKELMEKPEILKIPGAHNGMAAVQIEDQELPKKCGHLNGKKLVSTEDMMQKIQTLKEVAPSLIVIARTDAKAVEGLEKDTQKDILNDMQTREELYETIHYYYYEDLDQKIAKTILPEISEE